MVRLRATAVIAVTVPMSWAVLGVYACHSALPYNPVKLPLEESIDIRTWFPQGWCFFTRNPREDRLFALQGGADGKFTTVLASQSEWPRRFAGFDRRERAVWIEAGILFASVPPTEWTECKKRPAACLAELGPRRKILNPSPQPRLCGKIGLIRRRILPWAWAHARAKLEMPSKVVLVEVECSA